MFTGIVLEIGTVRSLRETPSGVRLEIECAHTLDGLAVGDSVSVAGACLTAIAYDDRSLTVDVVPETLARTTLGGLAKGGPVNLEPAVRPTTALGGHFVQGHVDGRVTLLARTATGDGARLRFSLPAEHERLIVTKGFVTLDGVSLTVAALEPHAFEIALIPHTAERTTLGLLREGDEVNLETDIIGRYVERLLAPST